ncbi:CoA transferase [Kutzneria sp. NPDC051319]|uniref:CaiB/BaiF CoA transferase family protein n=1 Tax=Kutzneria sp. NPDC051319 TaxID=3155047 RepID=UPI003428F01C
MSGIRVLELGNYIAAPTAGRLLADFGADVIKVERPAGGDELRRWRLVEGDTSLLYRTINRGKRSVTLDLRSDAGRKIALDLASHCDVVLENFRPGTLERWGLGPDELRAVRPDIVLVRISAYGQNGPYRDRPGFGAIAEAVGGLRELTGEPDRLPARTGVSLADSVAGLYAVIGALMCLLRREGGAVDVALHEAVFSLTESLLPDFEAYGVQRERLGGRMEGVAPSNAYACADGTVIIAGNGDSIFRRFMDVIERPDLASDPLLATNDGRWARRDEIDFAIGQWTRRHDISYVLCTLEKAGVPAGRIYQAADIARDPQYLARGMVQQLDVPGMTTPIGFPGVVPRIDDKTTRVRSLGPDLGAHTRDVLAGLLDFTDDQIDDLYAEEVL